MPDSWPRREIILLTIFIQLMCIEVVARDEDLTVISLQSFRNRENIGNGMKKWGKGQNSTGVPTFNIKQKKREL